MTTESAQLRLFDPAEQPDLPSRYFIAAPCALCGELCSNAWGLDAAGKRWQRSNRCACHHATARCLRPPDRAPVRPAAT